MQKHWIFIGAIHAGLAVALGAFGAHGLVDFLAERHLDDPDLAIKRLGDWKTAASYQMYHAIGMILIGIVSLHRQNKLLNIAGWFFWFGITLFSGLLYVLVLTEIRVLGAIVPLGGLSFIAGWVCFAIGGCCLSNETVDGNRLTELK